MSVELSKFRVSPPNSIGTIEIKSSTTAVVTSENGIRVQNLVAMESLGASPHMGEIQPCTLAFCQELFHVMVFWTRLQM